jgi:hypothetical protein
LDGYGCGLSAPMFISFERLRLYRRRSSSVTQFCSSLRVTLQRARGDHKRDLPLRLVQEFQAIGFLEVGGGVFGCNKVIVVRAWSLRKLLGSYNDLRVDRELHPFKFLQAALYFRYVTLKKEDKQERMSIS